MLEKLTGLHGVIDLADDGSSSSLDSENRSSLDNLSHRINTSQFLVQKKHICASILKKYGLTWLVVVSVPMTPSIPMTSLRP